jgi:hypothetical protein
MSAVCRREVMDLVLKIQNRKWIVNSNALDHKGYVMWWFTTAVPSFPTALIKL